MPITTNEISNTVLGDINTTITRLATYQEQLSTGLAVNQPSDNPAAAREGMRYQAEIDANTGYIANANQGSSFMTDADSAFTQMTTLMTQVTQAAVQGANGTEDASSRQALGQSVNSLLTQLVSLANTQSDGQYVFGGSATSTQPFVESTDGSSVTYQGNLDTFSLQVGAQSSIPINQNGYALFKSPVDVFGTLIQLRDALNNNDPTTVSTLITTVASASTQIQDAQGALGGNEQRMTLAQNQLQSAQTTLTTRLGQAVDANLPDTVSEMQQAQTALQSGLEAAAKILTPNLLSYLPA
jgi:flagellar hook-associated protein 3 FlgL